MKISLQEKIADLERRVQLLEKLRAVEREVRMVDLEPEMSGMWASFDALFKKVFR